MSWEYRVPLIGTTHAISRYPNPSTKIKLFGQILTPLKKKRRFAFMPRVVVKTPLAASPQNLSFIRADTVLRPL